MISYLAHFAARIMPGVLQWDNDRRERLRSYFLSALAPNGGFRGQGTDGDLYYTAFALRGLFLLGGIEDENVSAKVSAFLHNQRHRQLNPAELLSLLFCTTILNTADGSKRLPDETESFLNRLEHFRRPDGCFAASEKSAYSSTYATFLATIIWELLGTPERSLTIPMEPIFSRHRADGGFAELLPLRHSGTNPTAAAIGLFTLAEVPLAQRQAVTAFLCRCQQDSGGFQAHERIPIPDLLSSFSAATALFDLAAADQCNLSALRNFVTKLRTEDGGYRGTPLDTKSDVEYTFYGMALEAMLAICVDYADYSGND